MNIYYGYIKLFLRDTCTVLFEKYLQETISSFYNASLSSAPEPVDDEPRSSSESIVELLLSPYFEAAMIDDGGGGGGAHSGHSSRPLSDSGAMYTLPHLLHSSWVSPVERTKKKRTRLVNININNNNDNM